MRPLDPHEKSILRGIEEQLIADDPRLVRRVRAFRPGPLVRCAPTRWPASVFLTLGAVLLIIGVMLPEGSSLLGGFLVLVLGWIRKRTSPARSPRGSRPADSAPG